MSRTYSQFNFSDPKIKKLKNEIQQEMIQELKRISEELESNNLSDSSDNKKSDKIRSRMKTFIAKYRNEGELIASLLLEAVIKMNDKSLVRAAVQKALDDGGTSQSVGVYVELARKYGEEYKISYQIEDWLKEGRSNFTEEWANTLP